jgi:fucose permease
MMLSLCFTLLLPVSVYCFLSCHTLGKKKNILASAEIDAFSTFISAAERERPFYEEIVLLLIPTIGTGLLPVGAGLYILSNIEKSSKELIAANKIINDNQIAAAKEQIKEQIAAAKEQIKEQIAANKEQIAANKELIAANKEINKESIAAFEAKIENLFIKFSRDKNEDT